VYFFHAEEVAAAGSVDTNIVSTPNATHTVDGATAQDTVSRALEPLMSVFFHELSTVGVVDVST
jgi:hypothetical protein